MKSRTRKTPKFTKPGLVNSEDGSTHKDAWIKQFNSAQDTLFASIAKPIKVTSKELMAAIQTFAHFGIPIVRVPLFLYAPLGLMGRGKFAVYLSIDNRTKHYLTGEEIIDLIGRSTLTSWVNSYAQKELANQVNSEQICAKYKEFLEKLHDTKEISEQSECVVYLIRCGDLYKIGKSRHLAKRFKQLSTQIPQEVQLIHTRAYKETEVDEAEIYWHRVFHTKRVKGEWFKLTHEDILLFLSR
jgi:hypothetical protein